MRISQSTNRTVLPGVATIVLSLVAAGRQDAAPAAVLEHSLPELMAAGAIPGLAIAVIEERKLTWHGAFGLRDTRSPDPIGANTVFQAASLSKPVVAYALLRMFDRAEIELDVPLADYLPYPDIAHDERYLLITARTVLSHQTGFPNWRGDGPLRIQFTPGERYQYSGEGFMYLQKVIEKLSGLPLHELVQREVLDPLGMDRSSFVWEPTYDENFANGHDQRGSPGEKRKPTVGLAAGTLHTTARDYARFMIALMTGEGLEPETSAEMLSPQVRVEGEVYWGLGVGLQRIGGGMAFWQWGDDGDFKAFMIGDWESGSGLVYLTNSSHGLSIAQALVASVFGAGGPALAYLDYERHDSPARTLHRELLHAFLDEGVEAGVRRYHELRTSAPGAVGETFVNDLGYVCLNRKRLPEAIAIFELNAELHPRSWNVHDSLGEAYERAGERERAIASYQRSLELNPAGETAAKILAKLREP